MPGLSLGNFRRHNLIGCDSDRSRWQRRKHTIKKWKSVLAAALLLIGTLHQVLAAGIFEDGATAYARGDCTGAMTVWRPLADRGDGDAQQAVGLLYDLGCGVPQDFVEADSWYRRAAEGGNKDGQFRLGFMYEYGLGITKDSAQAFLWYRKAADQGVTAAETELARAYLDGVGVAQDYHQALIWIKKAEQDGDKYVANLMSEMYVSGRGVERDPQKADEWREKERFNPEEFWAGTERLPPISDQLTAEIVQRMEADVGIYYPQYRRYYAAVSMRRPGSVTVFGAQEEYYALMSEYGAARVAVRGLYLAGQFGSGEPGVSIVPDNELPGVSDGGCSVVKIGYDASRRKTLPTKCNPVR